MKKYILVVLLCIWSAASVFSQTTVSFATGGTPVWAAPWVTAGSTSVVGTHVQLTPPSGSQNGRIYTSTPITLTGCGSFTAEFEFQVIPSSSAWAIADGIAFWILSPLTGFIGGGGIGLPANPNGLVLVLDNYDNDGVPNDPLISLYGYPTGFTGTYVEGTTTNRIGALNNQVFVTDGGWHHVKLTYAGGQVKVYFNHSAIPSISGTYSITSPSLYFGFCASTGGAWSTQSVRNCVITFDNISPINGPNVVCLSTTPTYTDSTAGGTWSSSTPAVGTIASTGVFTPISAGTTTISYTYASGACVATKVVTVDATTLPVISGPTPLCSSSTGTYTNTITGGTWSSSSSIVATIGSSSGILTPVKSGNVTITYTAPSGCYITKAVTINTAPPPLSISPAPAQVCDNGSLTLTASGSTAYNLFPPQSWENGVPTTPGVPIDGWSYIGTPPSTWYRELGATAANPAIGSAMSGSYVANFRARSLASGTTGYLMSPPFSMVGVTSATLSLWVYRDATAAYNTTTYNNEYIYVYLSSTTGGTGVVGYIPRRTGAPITGSLSGPSTPATSGWYQYTYTIPGTVTGAGNYVYIYGQSANGNNIYLDSVTLTGTIGPPTWSPNTYLFNDAAFTTAYSGSALNPVYMHPTGITSPSTITYTATLSNGTCTSTGTSVVTMNPNPAPITGLPTICVSSSITLSSATTGGSWTSSNTAIATIGSSSGVITGISPGTTMVTYAFGGCFDTAIVTVVASPGAITGIPTACLGSTTTLSNPTAGGTWSSSNTAVGTVNPTTGIVTGISLGTTTITYGIATCFSTMTVTVNPYPSTITGSLGVCVGSTTALSSSPSGGFWFTSAPGVATVGVVTGVVTGVSAGTALISYRVGGCATITTVNVVTTPGPITGSLTTCVGSTTTLAHATPSGTWTSSTPGVATVGSSTGIVTGVSTGTSRITYSVGTGCFTTSVVTVNAAPPAPTGTLGLCVGQTSTLAHSTAGGTWSMACPTVATVGISTGIVTAIGAGTCTVTYTLPSGCIATAVVTVNGAPGAITGTLSLCQGTSATLSSATPSGTWTSGTPAIASIDLATGAWTALTGGTSTITYTAPTGCITTADVTVNLAPAAITGPSAVCMGQTMTLSCTSPAGAWSSSDPTVATVSGTGDVFGVAVGTADITYALASGCFVTKTVTVNPGPSGITGPLAMCVGACNTYVVSTPGGTWSSSAPTVAAMLSPGYLCGSSAGATTITYLVGATGCYSTLNVTVNTLPGTIGGTLSACVGQCNTLTNSAGGGTWSSSNPAVATINTTTGLFCGVAAGTSTITYSLGSGCITTTVVTVNALPGAISGSLSLCQGGTTTISSTPGGGTWISDNPTVVGIGVGTGIITTGAGSGTATVSYTLSTGCRRTAVVTVNPLPTAITGTTSVCAGQCTTLNSTPAGGTWSSVSAAVGTINSTTGVFCGVGAGTTTVSYTLATGCARTTVMLVNGLPTAISPSGAGLQVCEGSTLSLTGSPAGGTWSVTCPATGTIATGSGTYTGIGAGTCNVTYTLASGCSLVSAPITVNPLPGAITGVLSVCIGQTTTVSCTPATGTWSITAGSGTATIGSTTGVITGSGSGTATITYTLPTGCRKTAIVTINALPGLITGAANVCVSGTTTLNCTPGGGTWTIAGSAATIGLTTGIVSGVTAGTAEVTYTAGAGCFSTRTITVNPLPSAITGTPTTCVGQCTTLGSATAGGTWSSSTPAIGSINTATTSLCGVTAGTTIVSYTLPTTCRVTQIVTVYALPSAIGGSLQVCQGATGTLTTTTPGGTWASSNPSVGTVDAMTGAITGITTGTTTVTYTLGTGCSVTAVVTVNNLPGTIGGSAQVCEGQTITLTNATPSGTWSTSTPTVATIGSSTGIVTGVIPGTATISYSLSTGCSSTVIVTVHALPTTITGPIPMWVCENGTITVGSTPGTGTWSSPDPNVSVDPATGVVTGLAAGTATIVRTIGIGCVRTTTVTVNPQPAAITGNLNVCIGLTQTLATLSSGGTWSSSNPASAPVDAAGTVSGVALGTANISYTLPVTGCSRSVIATVQPLPSTITGSAGFCNLSSTMYLSSPGGGTWTSDDTSILTIDPTTGLATGVSVDTATITYTLPTGCKTTKDVFLILAPYPITGPHDMCLGQARTLSNVISGGVWSSSDPSVAPINPSTGVVIGSSLGVATITYVLSTGCSSTYSVTVNPIPVGTSGPIQVCVGNTATYSNSTPGGTWSSSDTTKATIDVGTGVLTALSQGVVTVTYTLGSGCNAMFTVTVNPLPDTITGPNQVCEGSSVSVATTTIGGLWSSHDPGVADVGALTGLVTGMSAMTPGVLGTGVTIITYTLPTGCFRTTNMTVNPLPNPITGPTDICVGDVAMFYNSTPGGGWMSSNPAIGTIDGVTGLAGGISGGNTIISYVLPSACVATRPLQVHDNPAPISGTLSVCAGFATNLTSSPTGGVWSQNPTSMPFGTIHPATGVVSGITAGVIPVTYTLGSGCRTVNEVTVITLPAVAGGPSQVCVSDSIVMTHPTAGGTWSSSNAARATVDPLTGMIHGISAGTAVITYSVSTGCFNVRTITVNALPTPITGPLQVCEGSTITLGSTPTPGGVWVSDTTAAATVGYLSGVVTGIAAGYTNISYVLGATGCLTRVQVTVNVTPPTITGNPHICFGSSNTFSNTMAGGSWISSNPAIATIDPATGVASSVSLGVVTISYVLPVTGCMATKTVSVDPLPNVYNVTGGGNYCAGGTGVTIGLGGSQPGVSYELYRGTSVTGYLPGTGFGLNFGPHTAAGVYTVLATDVTSGCQRNMSGGANVVINPLVTPTVSIGISPYDSVCPGQSVTLTAVPVNGGTAPTYLWKVNGVSVSTAGSYVFVPAHGDNVTVTMTSNANCLATTTATGVRTLTVLPTATPVAGVLTTPNDTICQFNPVTFTAAPSYGGATPVYQWLVNGVVVGTGSTYSYIPVDGDMVNLRMTSDYRCRTVNTVTSGDVAMSVDSILIPNVTVWADSGTTVTAGKPVTLHASATDAGPSPKFQWKVNGYAVAGATNSSYTAIFNDYDSISCQVTSSGVCANIGTHDWIFITTTILGAQTTGTMPSDIRLLPNPNKGIFTVRGTLGTGNEDVNIDVTDMLGQVVYRGAVTTKQGRLETQINLDGSLANGMYILTLRSGTEQKVFHFVMEQ